MVAGPAVLKRRIGAIAVDMALVTMLSLVLRSVVGPGMMSFGILAVFTIAVYGVVQGETGSSPGKAFFGLKLVNEKGNPPGTGPALIRLAAWVVDGLPCLGILGCVLVWYTPTHQRIGDTITRTFVVSNRDEPEEPAAAVIAPGPAPERYSSGDEQRQDFDPIWDAKVGAYVQWDPAEKRWMKYEDASGAWEPVEAD